MGARRLKIKLRPLPRQSEARGTKLESHGLTRDEELMLATAGIERMSMPERRIYGWLVRHKIEFESQVPLMGGRRPGGAVVDFIIYTRVPPIVLRVQSYWHTDPAAKSFDDYQKQAIEDLGYQVVDVWEYELSGEEETHFTMVTILYGAPKPRGLGVGIGELELTCPYCGRPGCFQCSIGGWHSA